MPKYRSFLDGLASEGGNILVLLVLVIIMMACIYLNIAGSVEQLYLVIGALLATIKGNITAAWNGSERRKREETEETKG